jgi:nitrogen fixation NifU-like protein
MSDALYQERIVALAKSRTGAGKLSAPTQSVRRDNPLCGDRVTIDLKLEEGKIAEIAHQVRGCLLCQASAAALAAVAVGCDAATIAEWCLDAERALGRVSGQARSPFDAFAPVANHKSRHDCVMLPLATLKEALT